MKKISIQMSLVNNITPLCRARQVQNQWPPVDVKLVQNFLYTLFPVVTVAMLVKRTSEENPNAVYDLREL